MKIVINFTHVQMAETRHSFLRPWMLGTKLAQTSVTMGDSSPMNAFSSRYWSVHQRANKGVLVLFQCRTHQHNYPVCVCIAGLCICLRQFVYVCMYVCMYVCDPKIDRFNVLHKKNPAECIILLDRGIWVPPKWFSMSCELYRWSNSCIKVSSNLTCTCRYDSKTRWRLHSVNPTSTGISSLGQNIIHSSIARVVCGWWALA